jgi:hypothetical protein
MLLVPSGGQGCCLMSCGIQDNPSPTKELSYTNANSSEVENPCLIGLLEGDKRSSSFSLYLKPHYQLSDLKWDIV